MQTIDYLSLIAQFNSGGLVKTAEIVICVRRIIIDDQQSSHSSLGNL